MDRLKLITILDKLEIDTGLKMRILNLLCEESGVEKLLQKILNDLNNE